jgi:hypothetical protein
MEPIGPRGGVFRMKLSEKLREQSRVLSLEGEDAKAPKFFRDTDIVPSNFALSSIARFLASPEESPSPLVNGLENSGRNDAGRHSVGKHGS